MGSELDKVLSKAKELAESIERDREELVRKFEELSKKIEEDAKRLSAASSPPTPPSTGSKASPPRK